MNQRDEDISMRKVFLLHNVIDPTRLPIFEKLATRVDLDVYFCMVEH